MSHEVDCAAGCGNKTTVGDGPLNEVVVGIMRRKFGEAFRVGDASLCRPCFAAWREDGRATALVEWEQICSFAAFRDFEKLVEAEIANPGEKAHRAPKPSAFFSPATIQRYGRQIELIEQKRRRGARGGGDL
jgi:hypothetical protein